MKKNMRKFLTLGLSIVALMGGSIQKASATEIMLPLLRNIVTGETAATVNKGWVQNITGDGTINWVYFDEDGTKHIGWLNDNGKYYHFDLDGNLTTVAVN